MEKAIIGNDLQLHLMYNFLAFRDFMWVKLLEPVNKSIRK